MRITHRAVAQTSLLGLNGNLDRIGKLQQQLTSGRVLNAPSDSPTGTNTAMQVRQSTAAITQQARNISDGKSWLDTADTALNTMLDQVRKVRDLTLGGLNTGSVQGNSASAISTELSSLRQSLLELANQTINGRPVFGGATTGTTAYDVSTGAFVGVGGTGTAPTLPSRRTTQKGGNPPAPAPVPGGGWRRGRDRGQPHRPEQAGQRGPLGRGDRRRRPAAGRRRRHGRHARWW